MENVIQLIDEGVVIKNEELIAYAMVVSEQYDKLPLHDKNADKYWESLILSNDNFLKKIQSVVKVIFVDHEPYKNEREMFDDWKQNKRLMIWKGASDTHPKFGPLENWIFRSIHDSFHNHNNLNFDLKGELNAYNTHKTLAPKEAIPALFTEVVGQVCYCAITGNFTDEQKVAVMHGFDFTNIGRFTDSNLQKRFDFLLSQILDPNIENIHLDLKGYESTNFKDKISEMPISQGFKIKHQDKYKKEPLQMVAESEEKKEDGRKYEFGCLMLDFNVPGWDKFTGNIKPEDIYDEPGFGIETSPHCTILFGFHKEVSFDDLKPILEKFKEPIKIQINGISHFSGPSYDVVKFDVESKTLKMLNKKCTKFPQTNNFPEYHPHITLAYVKKGEGKKYDINFTKPITMSSRKFSFSNSKKERFYYDIEKNEEQKQIIKNELFVKKDVDNLDKEKLKFIKQFIDYSCEKLKLKNPIKVFLQKNRDQNISTTASYHPDTNEIYIKCGGRNLVDLLRSISHEISHAKQNEDGRLTNIEKDGSDGSFIENEANSKAGEFIRKYGKLHPEIYDL